MLHKSLAMLNRIAWQVLTLGDTGKRIFEEIYMFSHWDRQTRATFISLTTVSGASISATPGHYLWAARATANGFEHIVTEPWTLVRAADVKIGACLILDSEPGCSRVVHRALTVQQGLFNPHTKSGSIVVDGIAATTFSDILPPTLRAHATVTAPFRWLFQACRACHAVWAYEALNAAVLMPLAHAPRVHTIVGKLWVQLASLASGMHAT